MQTTHPAERLCESSKAGRRSYLSAARSNRFVGVESMTGSENRDRVNLRRPTARNMHGYILYGQEAHPQELRTRPRGRADAEPYRGPKEFVRPFSANGRATRTAWQCRLAGSPEIGVSNPRFFGACPARIRALRARNAEI